MTRRGTEMFPGTGPSEGACVSRQEVVKWRKFIREPGS